MNRLRATVGTALVPLMLSSAMACTGDEGRLHHPVQGAIKSTYGLMLHPLLGDYRLHEGIDYADPDGSPVMAAAGGTVIEAGRHGFFGNLVVVEHGAGLETAYAHLRTIEVSVGQCVGRSQVIGHVGATGLTSGPVLHFEVRRSGVAMDPLRFLPDDRPAAQRP